MKPDISRILTINGGSSSIKFALFEVGKSLSRIAVGSVDRIVVRVIHTDEEQMIANLVCRGLNLGGKGALG